MNSGEYRYFLNGQLAPIEENWSTTGGEGGIQQVNSSRTAGNVSISVGAEFDAGYLRSCRVEWRSGSTPQVSAEYRQTVGGIRWRRSVDGAATSELINTSHEAGVVLYPLMRIFTGHVITALAASGGEGQVLVPNIAGEDPAELLAPELSRRRVVCVGEDFINGPAGSNCHKWQFVGGQYDDSAAFWLDEIGRLTRYRWRQSETQLWEVDLVER